MPADRRPHAQTARQSEAPELSERDHSYISPATDFVPRLRSRSHSAPERPQGCLAESSATPCHQVSQARLSGFIFKFPAPRVV